jgi:hypothetical protein
MVTCEHMFSGNQVLINLFNDDKDWDALYLSHIISIKLPAAKVTNFLAAHWIELLLVRGPDLAKLDYVCWLSEEGFNREQSGRYTKAEMDAFYATPFLTFVKGVLSYDSMGYELRADIKERLIGIISNRALLLTSAATALRCCCLLLLPPAATALRCCPALHYVTCCHQYDCPLREWLQHM